MSTYYHSNSQLRKMIWAAMAEDSSRQNSAKHDDRAVANTSTLLIKVQT